ncbi:MAG: FAD-dependent oxidoreductase, partial [Actinobacteria bacterium]|nr:FAD-dependent oxidoreductase [Actinomycetota bacterium]
MYDVIIIGAGPAGLASALYATRYKLNTLVVGSVIGGTALEAYNVENYPGFKSISGFELMGRMEEQVTSLGVKIIPEEVTKIEKNTDFSVITEDNKYEAKSLILTMGTERRKLNVPGEKELLGKGVSYCATCDSAFFKDKTVAVVGGSDAAAKSALLLAEYAKKIFMIYRRDKIRSEPIIVESVEKNEKIE